ncbi:MAG: hypothetical protein QW728_04695, partial [Thermoplasmata archaeon]
MKKDICLQVRYDFMKKESLECAISKKSLFPFLLRQRARSYYTMEAYGGSVDSLNRTHINTNICLALLLSILILYLTVSALSFNSSLDHQNAGLLVPHELVPLKSRQTPEIELVLTPSYITTSIKSNVTFIVKVTNRGNGVQNITLAASSEIISGPVFDPPDILLSPGETGQSTGTFNLVPALPGGHDVRIAAISDGQTLAEKTLTVNITDRFDVSIEGRYSTLSPGKYEKVVFEFTVKNLEDPVSLSINISLDSSTLSNERYDSKGSPLFLKKDEKKIVYYTMEVEKGVHSFCASAVLDGFNIDAAPQNNYYSTQIEGTTVPHWGVFALLAAGALLFIFIFRAASPAGQMIAQPLLFALLFAGVWGTGVYFLTINHITFFTMDWSMDLHAGWVVTGSWLLFLFTTSLIFIGLTWLLDRKLINNALPSLGSLVIVAVQMALMFFLNWHPPMDITELITSLLFYLIAYLIFFSFSAYLARNVYKLYLMNIALVSRGEKRLRIRKTLSVLTVLASPVGLP